MTDQEIEVLTGIKARPLTPQEKASIESGKKWRAEMEAKIKAMPEPERSKQWERWQNRLAKWND